MSLIWLLYVKGIVFGGSIKFLGGKEKEESEFFVMGRGKEGFVIK